MHPPIAKWPPHNRIKPIEQQKVDAKMVLRMLWNIGSGLTYRLLNKSKMPAGLAAVHYPSVWRGRTGFLDCDVNLHLNNASYLYNMELARWHQSAVSGLLWQMAKHGRMMFVGSQAVRYRHAIPPFHAYEIHTEIPYWDDQWAYWVHRFQDPVTGRVYAEALVRGAMMQRGKRISAGQMFAEVCPGGTLQSPTEMPEVIKGLLEWDAACRASMEASESSAKTAIKESPPPPAPEKLHERVWEEMKRSMNKPF